MYFDGTTNRSFPAITELLFIIPHFGTQSQGERKMKKAFIIFIILFALTLTIPAIAASTAAAGENNTQELVTIFS